MSDVTGSAARPRPEISWVGAMGLGVGHEDGVTHARPEVVPEMFAPGTDRIRIGILTTMVDVVGGMPPSGALNPTVDMRVQLFAPPPTSGTVHLLCRPLKEGRRIYVAEVPMFAGESQVPFGLGTVTFMSNRLDIEINLGRGRQQLDVGSFDELLGATHLADGTSELLRRVPVSNGVVGTIQGGAQAMFAEVAIDWARSNAGEPPLPIVDLDIRFLNRLDAGPLRARPEATANEDGSVSYRVPLTDAGDDDRIVSYVTARTLPAPR